MPKKILTVEESKALSYVISTVLNNEYEVANANDCLEALHCLQSDDKDLIILNIPNAESENLDLLKHLRTSAAFENIPTVVLANADDESLRNQSFELGASLFLTKPFDPVFLSDRVKDLVKNYTDAKKRKTKFNLNIF